MPKDVQVDALPGRRGIPENSSTVQMSRLIGILPTYHRQQLLADTLENLFQQSRILDRLCVVDNETSDATQKIVVEVARRHETTQVEYLATPANLGSAGGWAHGMSHVLPDAAPGDWLLTLDDDDPPRTLCDVERMHEFAQQQQAHDPQVAAVGVVGARINWWTGKIARLPDELLHGAVPVDYVGSGHMAMYSVRAMQQVGVFLPELFFGFTEVEYCIRLKRAGFSIYANGDLWREERTERNRLDLRPKRRLSVAPTPRLYYSTRNYIYIMKRYGRPDLALKHALVQTFLRPALMVWRSPGDALRTLRLTLRASYDAVRNRMGRSLEL